MTEKTPAPVRQGLLRRLFNTPLRDLVRGRFTGRLDVRHCLRQAEIPAELRGIVLDVVHRTRLWRFEKADVGRELIAHFRDGLARGESPDALAAAFGPSRRAARLIRRAKRRGRSRVWRTWLRAGQAAGLVLGILVGIYLVATIRLLGGRPVIARDYVVEINAAAAVVPAGSRGWDLYRKALLSLGDVPRGLTSGDVFPGASGWPEAAGYLQRHGEAMELVRQGASRPGLGYLVGYGIDVADRPLWPDIAEVDWTGRSLSDRLASDLLPYLGSLNSLGWLLSVDALRAAELGDGTLATADIEAIMGIARHALEVPLLLNNLVAFRQVSLGVTTLGEILADQPEVFADEQLGRLAHRLTAVFGGRLSARFEGEQMLFDDFVQRLYTDDGDGDGRLTAQGLSALGLTNGTDGAELLAPIAGLVIAGRRAYADEYRRLLAIVEAEFARPLWRRDEARLGRETGAGTETLVHRLRYPLIGLLIDAYSRVGTRPELVSQERDAICVAIALELYRRRHGAWPATLAELIPDLLPEIPLDRYDGAPLRYQLIQGKPVIYSVGKDGNDDGLLPRDGDLVLWPILRPQWGEPDPAGISRRASRGAGR